MTASRIEGLLQTQDGGNRPITLESWWAPAVELAPDEGPNYVVVRADGRRTGATPRLRWNPKSDAGHWVTSTAGVLPEFITLENASPERILRFAKKWGVLEICRHGLPRSHFAHRFQLDDMPASCYPQRERDYPSTLLRPPGEWAYWEDVAVWRTYARKFAGLLDAAAHIREREEEREEEPLQLQAARERLDSPPDEPGHALLSEFSMAPGILEVEERQPNGRWAVNHAVSGRRPPIGGPEIAESLSLLVEHAGIRPRVVWAPPAWVLTFTAAGRISGSGLFPVLVMQLFLAVAGVDGLALCSGCERGYVPRGRRPKMGRRAFCSKKCARAGRKETWRRAQRRHRHPETNGP